MINKMTKQFKKTLIAGLVALATIFSSSPQASAEQTNASPRVSANVSVGILNKNILLNGVQQGSSPMATYSGNLNYGNFGIFGAISKEDSNTREVDTGLSYMKKFPQNSLGKPSLKVTLEKKSFPDKEKEMDLSDIILGLNTKFGDFGLIYRERFGTSDYESGRTEVLTFTTRPLNLGKIANLETSVKGTSALAYQDSFVETSRELAYLTPGINLGLKRNNLSIEAFLKTQRTLRDELKNENYGGIRATYSF
jgi:hypothetical protein